MRTVDVRRGRCAVAAALAAAVLASCSSPPPTAAPTYTPAPHTLTPGPLPTRQVRVVTPYARHSSTPGPTPTPPDTQPPPNLGGVSKTWTSKADGMVLVGIPAGEFRMGSPADDPYAEPDEIPMRRVTLDGYWVDQTEVTNEMYARCVEAGKCLAPPSQFADFSPHPYFGDPAYANYPVVNVTWTEAQDYCRWVGRRLPTEAEWEKAARGRDARRFPWEWIGVPVPDKLNFCDSRCAFPGNAPEVDDGFAETSPVGSYPKGASPYGILDMAGNVWEWTADWYADDYYGLAPTENPAGPATGELRVVRGGSWLDGVFAKALTHARAANRYALPPDASRSDLGFRCAASSS